MAPDKHSPRIVQGGVYNVLPMKDLIAENIPTDLTPKARSHMVLILGPSAEHRGCWRVMTITSKLKDIENYIPFAPLRKKPFPIQLRLVYGAQFRLDSYLKIDQEYYVRGDGLECVEVGDTGLMCRLYKSKSGSIAQLNDFLRNRERESRNVVVGTLGLERLAF